MPPITNGSIDSCSQVRLGADALELAASGAAAAELEFGRQRLLYVASPGVRDNLEWGGHGVLVFDINDGHRFVKRIPLKGHGINKAGKVLNVKGICANAKTGRLYVSTLEQLYEHRPADGQSAMGKVV